MAFAFAAPSELMYSQVEDDIFYAVIDRLKDQNALANHCFVKDLPFFNIASLPKEVQIREIFENACDPELCRHLLKNVVTLPEGAEYKMVPQNFSPISVMSFAQIVLYKVLPCPDGISCPNCPREIATHNQYKDFEYECPFYHHERDRRRLVIAHTANEEFVYKANYFEEGRRRGEKEKYSQNYFESMFHPLYYKMFKCKRDFCDHSPFCPFFHTEEEKRTWDESFSNFLRKDRVSYVKDKQQKQGGLKQRGQRRGSEEEEITFTDKRAQYRPTKMHKQNYQQNYNNQGYFEEWIDTPKFNYEKKLGEWKNELNSSRKDSNDSSFEEKYGYGFFTKLQHTVGNQIY